MANMRALILVAAVLFFGSSAAEDKPEPPAASTAPATAATKKPAFKPPAGYRVKIKEWDIVYCRKEPVLGSRFPVETCMTEQELKAHMAANDEMRRNKDQTSRVCSGNACN
jgi:hypothetical protein